MMSLVNFQIYAGNYFYFMETFHYTMADPQSIPAELLEYGMVVKQDYMVNPII